MSGQWGVISQEASLEKMKFSLSEAQRFWGMKKGYVGNLGGWILSGWLSSRSETEWRLT